MMAIRALAVALTVVMFGAIMVAAATGDFGEEGAWLLDHAWGRMTLIDLYVGIVLFSGWVVLREQNLWVAILWVPVFVVLGNAGTALYVAIAAFRTDDVRTFLLGVRA